MNEFLIESYFQHHFIRVVDSNPRSAVLIDAEKIGGGNMDVSDGERAMKLRERSISVANCYHFLEYLDWFSVSVSWISGEIESIFELWSSKFHCQNWISVCTYPAASEFPMNINREDN